MTPSLTNQQPENNKPDARKEEKLLEAKFPKSGNQICCCVVVVVCVVGWSGVGIEKEREILGGRNELTR
jgi:hypothetical protein